MSDCQRHSKTAAEISEQVPGQSGTPHRPSGWHSPGPLCGVGGSGRNDEDRSCWKWQSLSLLKQLKHTHLCFSPALSKPVFWPCSPVDRGQDCLRASSSLTVQTWGNDYYLGCRNTFLKYLSSSDRIVFWALMDINKNFSSHILAALNKMSAYSQRQPLLTKKMGHPWEVFF